MTSMGREMPRRRITARMRELRFDAGALSLNLVATVGRRPDTPIERLGDVERLHAWCRGVGTVLDESEDPAEVLALLHELRDAAYEIAAAAVCGRRPQLEAVELLNRAALVEPPAPQLRLTATGVEATEAGRQLSGPGLRSLIARDLITIMSDEELREHLRACDSDNCRMIYLDSAHGKPRKWCSMQRCGNSAKAAQHRLRLANSGR
ncbi:CGNR zinc finger domain-containing protein [Streptomyces sp. NPDC002917]|uniref:CGNR zinc finger domain-containing protein n=1 Tax=unclassified Streptomyces TaxID=2593676 RepID=UPI002E81E013|nr:CGNR zinc finger domain-containing protein [Streptomyces sp. NBC_00562]WTD31066.1 ABATE domain-containing protein [Streptomyces sp. NBC_01643]WUC17729.1 ABATE domain-containing protein [Streptomyces sp. NBC_00562]